MAKRQATSMKANLQKPEQPKRGVAAVEQVTLDALAAWLKTLQQITSRPTKLFPFGITKVSVTMGNFAVTIEGPQSGTPPKDVSSRDASSDIVFTITERVGKKARGTLSWAAKGLSAKVVSGDSAHDAINVGTWEGIAFQERPSDNPYCDASGNCWFSIFRDAYGRTGMGIHPDGGVPDATLGCIGIRTADTSNWHDALKAANGLIICSVEESLTVVVMKDDGVLESEK
jgi:hypothetical protein